jgi:hypothetical protein
MIIMMRILRVMSEGQSCITGKKGAKAIHKGELGVMKGIIMSISF